MIRQAQFADLSRLIELCAAHAAYEQCAYDPTGKQEALGKALFGSDPKLTCYVYLADGSPQGYITFTEQFSSWDARSYIYLDCIYLTEGCRNRGIGEQLMNVAREHAKTKGCREVQWQTPDFNEGAIRFYKRIGAKSKTKERFFWAVE